MSNSKNYLLVITFCFSVTVSAQDFYVSPLGNDQATGISPIPDSSNTNGPFQTLARAQQAIRDLKTNGQFKESVTVHIASGTYQLAKPLTFDVRDTGFAERKIIWKAETTDTIISGGIALSNCSAENQTVWSCTAAGIHLPESSPNKETIKNITIPTFNLYVDQNCLQLARWPDSGWAHIKHPLTEKNSYTSHEQLPDVNNSEQIQVHIFAGNDWFDEYIPVTSVDSHLNQINLAKNTTYPIISGERFYLENIQSELNVPGEWYYDQINAKILFIPPEQSTTPKVIVASSLANLINIKGAHFLDFQNLNFRYTTGIPILITDASHITFDNIEINAVDLSALDTQNCTELTISNSRIHDTGGMGIAINGGDRATLKPANNLIHNTHFHHLGRHFFAFTPAITTTGVGNRFTHNLIENLPGTGTAINGNDHLFENNELSHICEQSSDCGAIYSGRNWTNRGNIIRSNSIHDIEGYGLQSVDPQTLAFKYTKHGAVGLYLDDGVSSFSVIGNIFNKAGAKAIQLGGGRDHRIENNLFYTENCAICIDARWPNYDWSANRKSLTEVPYQNAIWKTKYPELALPMQHDTWPEGNVITHNIIISTVNESLPINYTLPAQSSNISNNLVWNTNGKVRVAYTILDNPKLNGIAYWPEWYAIGLEKNSMNADPCATITGNNVTFCANTPAKNIGFQPLSNDIGLIKP
ncbi:right-handed parallel beta-helix repeat-containing protein [Methylomonas sp. AM2-LC]|uniref:right-handed parallel beta-helix repeat-containing protein n=1 Tax=Methylomonas sp. AM2-LC TaxID=3153301 RepID=UPI00326497E9